MDTITQKAVADLFEGHERKRLTLDIPEPIYDLLNEESRLTGKPVVRLVVELVFDKYQKRSPQKKES